jgi:hypothetical protein
MHAVCCPTCQKQVRAALPDEFRAGYGSHATAITSLLHGRYRLSVDETSEVLKDLFELPMSTGSVVTSCEWTSEALKPAYDEVSAVLPQQAIANVDETGWKQNAISHWLWTVVTPIATLFHINRSQGVVGRDIFVFAPTGQPGDKTGFAGLANGNGIPADERDQGLDMAGFVPSGVSKELHQNGIYGTIVAMDIAHGMNNLLSRKIKEDDTRECPLLFQQGYEHVFCRVVNIRLKLTFLPYLFTFVGKTLGARASRLHWSGQDVRAPRSDTPDTHLKIPVFHSIRVRDSAWSSEQSLSTGFYPG